MDERVIRYEMTPAEAEACAVWLRQVEKEWQEFLQLEKETAQYRGDERMKRRVTVHIDPDVLGWFRASGAGWNTRINDALREWYEAHVADTKNGIVTRSTHHERHEERGPPNARNG